MDTHRCISRANYGLGTYTNVKNKCTNTGFYFLNPQS